MAALNLDMKEKAEVITLALFNYHPVTLTDNAKLARKLLLDDLEDIITNWKEMHDNAILVGGHIPKHVPGAYPSLSCCGGGINLVPVEE